MLFEDLYQEIILDHYRNPRNKTVLAEGSFLTHENPTCGDSLRVAVSLTANGTIEGIQFDGIGCAISTASASMMTEHLKGMTIVDARNEIAEVIALLRGEKEGLAGRGDLESLSQVARFPMRVKCATLAWHAVNEAISHAQNPNVQTKPLQ